MDARASKTHRYFNAVKRQHPPIPLSGFPARGELPGGNRGSWKYAEAGTEIGGYEVIVLEEKRNWASE